jgi:hypothetical protein
LWQGDLTYIKVISPRSRLNSIRLFAVDRRGLDQPVHDLRPHLAQNPIAHEQAKMTAVGGNLANMPGRRADQPFNGEELRWRHQFIIASRQQEKRRFYLFQIDRLS